MKNLLLLLSLFIATSAVADNVHVANRADWMQNLRDDVFVSDLCLPGAHDAASGQTHVYGTSVQTKTINELFDAGVRVFDFRTAIPSSYMPLRMYHNFVDLARTFSGVMDDLYSKLDDHPSEFCVVIIKCEGMRDKPHEVYPLFRSYFRHSYDEDIRLYKSHETGDGQGEDDWGLNFNHKYWKNDEAGYNYAKNKWAKFSADMRVGYARGKVILLFRNSYNYDDPYNPMAGPLLGSFTSNPEIQYMPWGNFMCQDAYHEDDMEWNMEYKFKRYVKPCCEKLTYEINRGNRVWCVNHLSGYTNQPAAPNSAVLARTTNRVFAKYLAENPDVNTGMVMMDYAGEGTSWGYTVSGDLALEAVIHQNWRYWKDTEDPQGHVEVNSN